MKRLLFSIFFSFLTISILAADPTQAPAVLNDSMGERAIIDGTVRLRGIVAVGGGGGVALVALRSGELKSIQAGSRIEIVAGEGMALALDVVRIDRDGVFFRAPSLPGGEIVLKPEYPVSVGLTRGKAGDLALVDFEELPLRDAVSLLTSCTGLNVAMSAKAGDIVVRLRLCDVSPADALSLLCSTAGVWYRPDAATGVPCILTMEEYQLELSTFREERTETFTLSYPNVVEVASVLYGLYPDRVYLTLGEKDILDDEKSELSRRFDRFRIIDDAVGSSSFSAGPSINSIRNSAASSGSFELADNTQHGRALDSARESTYKGLTPDEARRLEEARGKADAAAAESLLAAHADRSPSIFVTVSRRNNLIVVRTGDTKAMEEIRDLVRRLDVPTPMVLLEMRVVEFSISDGFESTFEYQFGGDYKLDDNKVSLSAGFPGFGALSNTARTDMFGFQVLNDQLSARMQLLETEGKARTLATPSLLVANNEVSRLFIGEEVPITTGVTLSPVSSTTVNGVTTVTGYTVEPNTEIRSIGTTLLVTPSINADRTVTLHLLEEESTVIPDGGSIPYGDASTLQRFSVDTVESRRVSGTFIAKDDLVAAIGGLIREKEVQSVSRVPILGRIPLIGFLFRSTVRTKSRTELVVFIRPHVFSTPRQGERISRDFLGRVSESPDLKIVYGEASPAPTNSTETAVAP